MMGFDLCCAMARSFLYHGNLDVLIFFLGEGPAGSSESPAS
jgi:hypothetical protein